MGYLSLFGSAATLDLGTLRAAIISSFDPIFAITPSFITSNLSTNERIDVRCVMIIIVPLF